MSILVVDDSLFARKKLCQLLESWGYPTLEAENGQDAVEKALAHDVRLVLMDITMPVMDGIQATRELKARGAQAKVVMLSALAQKAAVLEAIRAGAVDYLLKPYDADKLQQKVKLYLEE